MTVNIPGYSSISGKPEVVLKLMQEARVFNQLKGDEYIQSVQETAQRCFNIALDVKGDTYEERAESLLKEMAAHDMIKIEEEE